jgi:hypothetical protein
MHPGQVVAFAVVLDREFPVGGDLQREAAVGAAMVQRLVEFRPAGEEVGVHSSNGAASPERFTKTTSRQMWLGTSIRPSVLRSMPGWAFWPGPPTWGVATRRPSLA